LPRIERLRVQGKADETELPQSDEDETVEGETEESKEVRKEKREKMKMRGKGKTLKRYLRKKRKNVIDAGVVSNSYLYRNGKCLLSLFFLSKRLHYVQKLRGRSWTNRRRLPLLKEKQLEVERVRVMENLQPWIASGERDDWLRSLKSIYVYFIIFERGHYCNSSKDIAI